MNYEIEQLITNGNLVTYYVVPKWNGVTPALVLFFDKHLPITIPKEQWEEYWDILDEWEENNG